LDERKELDFDGKPLRLVETAYKQAKDYQYVIFDQCKRDYLLYRAYVDMTNRDNTLPNISLPKIFSIIETKAPQDVKSLLGMRPYIPYEAKRKEFQNVAEIQTELLDDYLEKAGFFIKAATMFKLKTLYGFAGMDFLPVYEPVSKASMIVNQFGMPEIARQEVYRLRLKIRVYAPWEVFVDPFATNMEERDGCRYMIKLCLTSKRAIKNAAGMGAYPNFDLGLLDSQEASKDMKDTDHFGYEILRDFGLDAPMGDDDMGILMRYESPDRYIDSWNGGITLRDLDNPFDKKEGGHGRINFARITHIQDAHTQNQIWGIGEAKPNEIQAAMLDDLYNSWFRREAIAGEPLIFYRKSALSANDLVWTTGNRIAVNDDGQRPIGDSVQVHTGSEMPKDQYMMIDKIERNMDMTARSFAVSRGEAEEGSTTATEIMQLRETGAASQELSIKIAEEMFLKSSAEICFGHINQFGTIDDYTEIVGPEKALFLLTANPMDIPGGCNIAFRGSNRVVNLLIKQRNLKELAPQLVQLFSAGQFNLAKSLMESHEIPKTEIEAIMQDGMMMMQMQMMQQQAQLEAKGTQPGGKYKENNPKQIAQKNAQDQRGK